MGFTWSNIFKQNKGENECMKILEMLDDILANEASDEEMSKFHDHLEKCLPCYEQYDLDKSVRELLKTRCSNAQVPDGLVESIKLQVSKSGSL